MDRGKGQGVRDLSSEPPLVAVALAYDPVGAWSSGIMLQYGAVTGGPPEYASVIDTYIVLPDEDFDLETRQVVKREPGDVSSEPAIVSDEGRDPFLPDLPD
jgi:hypothetical protein